MANDLNRCDFIGRLGGDPELKYTPSGMAVANFTLACNYGKKGEEKAEWVRVVAFDKLATLVSEYLKKGSQTYVSGRMQTRQWDDKQGNKRYTTEIIANQVQFLGAKGEAKEPPSTPEDNSDIPF